MIIKPIEQYFRDYQCSMFQGMLWFAYTYLFEKILILISVLSYMCILFYYLRYENESLQQRWYANPIISVHNFCILNWLHRWCSSILFPSFCFWRRSNHGTNHRNLRLCHISILWLHWGEMPRYFIIVTASPRVVLYVLIYGHKVSL